MGTDCAPFLANLYLFMCEYDFLDSLTKEDTPGAKATLRLFRNCFRYIDDLTAFNTGDGLDVFWPRIYPPELQLEPQNKTDQQVDFLDLTIWVEKGKFHRRLFDKRDAFPFEVISFPHTDSNIHYSSSHGVLIGGLVRFARARSSQEDFFIRARNLVQRLIRQKMSPSLLRKKCVRFFEHYGHALPWPGWNTHTFASKCFS